jgi:hypothetical protein
LSRFLVECRAEEWGSVPVRFGHRGEMRDVAEVLDRWPGEDHCYFRVAASDGAIYILRHDEDADSWCIHFFDDRAGEAGAPPSVLRH